jgi:hypothetical protein
MPAGDRVGLCVVVEGRVDDSRIGSLRDLFDPLRVVEAPAGATRDPVKLNRIVDEAGAPWILLAREGERVSGELAVEIAASASPDPRAWGYRIARRALYCGRTLQLWRRDPGEIRLYNRRKARLQPDGRMKVQGTVVRLGATLDVVVHESESAHIDALRNSDRREVGLVGRLTNWLAAMTRHAPRSLARPARRYLWIEAGWRDAE